MAGNPGRRRDDSNPCSLHLSDGRLPESCTTATSQSLLFRPLMSRLFFYSGVDTVSLKLTSLTLPELLDLCWLSLIDELLPQTTKRR